jgi:hypothetical protein
MAGYEAKYENISLTKVAAGDIFYETSGSMGGTYTGHVGIVEGKFYDIMSDSLYVRTIEVINGKVSYGIMDENRINDTKANILNINGSNSNVKSSVAAFAELQIGKNAKFISKASDEKNLSVNAES